LVLPAAAFFCFPKLVTFTTFSFAAFFDAFSPSAAAFFFSIFFTA